MMRSRWKFWRWKWLRRSLAIYITAFLLPLGLSVATYYVGEAGAMNWWEARNDTTHQAPDPATTEEAVVEVQRMAGCTIA